MPFPELDVLASADLLRTYDFVHTGRNDRALRRAAQSGELVSLCRGVFLPTDTWQTLTGREQHVARALAVAPRLAAGRTFSHVTAAALLGYPLLGRWPTLVDVTDPDLDSGRRGSVARLHALGLEAADVIRHAGLPVTTASRTAVDLAIGLPFRDAVVTIDGALRSETAMRPVLAEFDAALERRRPIRDDARVALVRSFADGRSGSPGESLSRVVLYEQGWPPPTLQQSFSDANGLIGVVDFWWPQFGIVGEFDGFAKYERADYRRGRTAAQVVVDEKRREDRLRAHPQVRTVARWMWADLERLARLEHVLTAAGLQRSRRPAGRR